MTPVELAAILADGVGRPTPEPNPRSTLPLFVAVFTYQLFQLIVFTEQVFA